MYKAYILVSAVFGADTDRLPESGWKLNQYLYTVIAVSLF